MRALAVSMMLLIGCSNNQSLCERSVAQINQTRAACGMSLLSSESMCFAYESIDDVDCRAYFTCEANRYTCVEGQFVQDLERCPTCE